MTPRVAFTAKEVAQCRLGEMLALTWDDVELGDGLDQRIQPRRSDTERGVRVDMGAAEAVGIRAANGDRSALERRGVVGSHGGAERSLLEQSQQVLGGRRTPHVRITATLHRIDGQWQRREPKTEKSRRVVPLPPITVEALRKIRRLHGLVFVTDKGYPLHGTNLPKELHKATDRLGLPRVGIHDLRHSAATIWHSLGVPIEVIADMLGHSTTRVTADLYRHRVPQLADDAAMRMQEAISGR